MRLSLVLVAVALVAPSCGGKSAASAAEVAPADTYLLIEGRPTPKEQQALAFLPESAELERLLTRAERLTGAGDQAVLVVLDRAGSRAAALAQPSDREQFDQRLDDDGIAHARVEGWTVFSREQASVDAVRHARRHLAETGWFRPVEGDATFIRRRGTVVTSTEDGQASATGSEPPRGTDAAHPLARVIPPDAVAAAAVHDGSEVFAALPFAAQLEDGVGLKTTTLAVAAPRDAVLYARPAIPAATVTLVAVGDDPGAARRIMDELAPNSVGVPGTVGRVRATDVSLGPIDLFYGRTGHTIFVTDDPAARLVPGADGDALAPEGLPAETLAWAYLDVPQGLPALQSLAALAGTHLSPAFERKLAGLRTLLAYRTRGALTVAVR